MRLIPSVRDIADALTRVTQRFAPVVLAAWGGAVTSIILNNQEGYQSTELKTQLWSVLMSCALAVPLLFALSIYGERFRRAGARTLLIAGGAVLAALYYWAAHADGFPQPEKWGKRFMILWAGAHFLVAVAGYLGSRKSTGFWRFNQILFLRHLLGTLYTVVLFAGLALALLSVHRLLGVDIRDKAYFRLWIVLVGGFHPVFFLAGVPPDLPALEASQPHPLGLRRFVQYVLFPLVAVYFAILYVYGVKIASTWTLPKGWLSWPVFILAVIGIFANLLLQPLEEDPAFRWTGQFRWWFYRLLLPLLPLLFIALNRRIHDYGITEGRYLGMVLAGWLTVTAAMFARDRAPSIKFIPASLAVLALLTAFGPWDAFAISYRSQRAKLVAQLQTAGLVRDGKATPNPEAKMDALIRGRVTSEVHYLLTVHGPHSIDDLMDGLPGWKTSEPSQVNVLKLLGLPNEYSQGFYSLETGPVIEIPSAAQISLHSASQRSGPEIVAISSDGTIQLDCSRGLSHLVLHKGSVTAPIDLDAKIAETQRRYPKASTQMASVKPAASQVSWHWTIDGRDVTIVLLSVTNYPIDDQLARYGSAQFETIVTTAP